MRTTNQLPRHPINQQYVGCVGGVDYTVVRNTANFINSFLFSKICRTFREKVSKRETSYATIQFAHNGNVSVVGKQSG